MIEIAWSCQLRGNSASWAEHQVEGSLPGLTHLGMPLPTCEVMPIRWGPAAAEAVGIWYANRSGEPLRYPIIKLIVG